jgi:hypothetical protein
MYVTLVVLSLSNKLDVELSTLTAHTYIHTRTHPSIQPASQPSSSVVPRISCHTQHAHTIVNDTAVAAPADGKCLLQHHPANNLQYAAVLYMLPLSPCMHPFIDWLCTAS